MHEEYNDYKEYLKEHLEEYRYIHSLNVADECACLAKKYDYDENKAYLAGLLHDVCKNETDEKQLQIFDEFGIILDNVQKKQKSLWHAVSGAAFVEHYFKIKDKEIISAIRYHSTGKEDMTKLEKILYLADFISAERDFKGVDELRETAQIDLDSAVFACLRFSIKKLCKKKSLIHKDTFFAYNFMVV